MRRVKAHMAPSRRKERGIRAVEVDSYLDGHLTGCVVHIDAKQVFCLLHLHGCAPAPILRRIARAREAGSEG